MVLEPKYFKHLTNRNCLHQIEPHQGNACVNRGTKAINSHSTINTLANLWISKAITQSSACLGSDPYTLGPAPWKIQSPTHNTYSFMFTQASLTIFSVHSLIGRLSVGMTIMNVLPIEHVYLPGTSYSARVYVPARMLCVSWHWM